MFGVKGISNYLTHGTGLNQNVAVKPTHFAQLANYRIIIYLHELFQDQVLWPIRYGGFENIIGLKLR